MLTTEAPSLQHTLLFIPGYLLIHYLGLGEPGTWVRWVGFPGTLGMGHYPSTVRGVGTWAGPGLSSLPPLLRSAVELKDTLHPART